MKHCCTLVLLAIFAFGSLHSLAGQNDLKPWMPSYDAAKKQGLISPFARPQVPASAGSLQQKTGNPHTVSLTSVTSNCSCLLPLDSTFSVVPFYMSPPPFYSNDDLYSDTIQLPFTFCYYGMNISELFINNNGNISFSSPYSTYTANPFPDATFNMVAPFWADVDTRGESPVITYDSLTQSYDTISPGTSHTGIVYYKITPTSLIVRWDSVGYFSCQGDKRNTFQLIITDGSDPLVPGGNNVAFCYGDMQWTTGAASGGVNGFGGWPATVGINKGDGTNFFQVGRFDHDSTDYDGPYGAVDGVSFLDHTNYFFTTCTSNNNIPPIALSDVCDTILVGPDTAVIVLRYIGPEQNQIVTAQVSTQNPNVSVLSNVPGNPCVITLQAVGINASSAFSQVSVLASDNASTPASTQQIITLNNPTVTGLAGRTASGITVAPNPGNGRFVVTLPGTDNQQVQVYNATGALVQQRQVNGSNRIDMDISSFGKGMYWLMVRSGGNTSTNKIIVE